MDAKDPRELEKRYSRFGVSNRYPYAYERYRGFSIHLMFVRYFEGQYAGPNDVLRDEYVVTRGSNIAGEPDAEFQKWGFMHRFLTKELARSFIDTLPEATPL